jgi:hypothetical protein
MRHVMGGCESAWRRARFCCSSLSRLPDRLWDETQGMPCSYFGGDTALLNGITLERDA